MDLTRKRNLFLAITVVLVVAIVAVSAVILVRGPRESSVELVSNNGDGTANLSFDHSTLRTSLDPDY